jgi:hypothetical protein
MVTILPTLRILLLMFAFVCFVVSTFNVPPPPRINWQSAGLACWIASLFLV